ncbi:uncharacterized protein LOC131248709 isoform X3 [Magnolia sinica]|uniref:uncharacterized protein LOC131248709 isoform X3 n=1 Tax=Magnolia sinica TaxID=86752 RepID=UPI00265B68A8|nr:uncharacterized protein LOC131248709 isoform X3 [Magnolia sinica]
MMSLGPFPGHGSSSSSTLSPLAQPFTVDRFPVPKPKPASPPNAFDDPFDYVAARSSLDNWLQLQPSTPVSDSFYVPSSDVDSVRRSYGYLGHPLIGSDGAHLPSIDPTACGFSYGQKSGLVTSSLIEAEPFYPQYLPAVHDKGDLGLKESGFGLSKSGAVGPLEGPSPSDYVQNLSGFGYNSVDWTGQWKDVDFSWRSSFQKGPADEGFMAREEASVGLHGKGIQSAARKVHIGSKVIGTEWLDAKCSGISEDSANVTSYNMPGTSGVAPGSVLQEMPYSQLPDPTSPTEVWNPFNLNTASYDMFHTEHEATNPTIFYPSEMSYTPPVQAFGPPASRPSSTPVAIVPKNMSSGGQPMDARNNKEAVGHVSANVKVPIIQSNAAGKGYADKNIISNYMKNDDYVFVGHTGRVSANVKVPIVQLNAAHGKESYGDKNRISNDTKEDDLTFVGPSPMKIHLPLKAPKPVIGESSNQASKANFEQGLPHIFVGPSLVKISSPLNLKAAVNNSSSHPSEVKSDLKQPHILAGPVKISTPLNPKPVIDGSSNHSLKAKPELELPHLNLANVSSAPGSAGPGDSLQSSSEEFDQFISAVDSPCWKGASSSRLSPFGAVDAVSTMAVLKESEGCSDLNQHCQISPVNGDDTEAISSPKPYGCLTLAETGFREDSSLSFPTKPLPVDCSEAVDLNGTQCSVGMKELENCYVLPHNPKGNSGLTTSEGMTSSQEDVVTSVAEHASETRFAEARLDFDAAEKGSTDFHSYAGEHGSNASSSGVGASCGITEMLGVSDNSSVRSLPKLESQMLVMMMFNISELLPYANALKERDYEVLRLVINNLQACVPNKVGLTKTMPESFPLKALTKVMEERTHEQVQEHPQTLLYKNLWFEAEAALCSMKHELARMKIEMEKYEQHQAKATDSNGPADVAGKPINEKLSSLNSISGTTAGDTYSHEAKESSTEKIAIVEEHVKPSSPIKPKVTNPMRMKEKVEDASAPKSKENPSEHVSTVGDDVDVSSHNNPVELDQLSMEGVEDVESSVMARFRVLKSRIDNLSCPSKTGQQQQPMPVVVGGSVPHCFEEKIERSKPWPFITDQSGERCLEVGNIYDGQCLPNDIGEKCLSSYVSQQQEMTKGFCLRVPDEPVIPSCMPAPLWNQFKASGFESPPSDWEHVLKEELKW